MAFKRTVFTVEGMKSVWVRVFIDAGSWWEKGSSWGAFHLLEHLLFHGTQRWPNRECLDDYRYDHGITCDAWTSGQRMTLEFRFPREELAEGLQFVEEFIFHNRLSMETIQNELSVITQEYNDKWSKKGSLFDSMRTRQLVGGKHLFMRDGLGQPDFAKTLTNGDLQHLYQTYFVTNRMSMVVGGSLDPLYIETWYKKLDESYKKEEPVSLLFDPIVPEAKLLEHTDNVGQPWYYFSWLLPGENHYGWQDRQKGGLFNTLLGVGPTSLLFRKLREELGLVYSVQSKVAFWPNFGVLTIMMTTKTPIITLESVVQKLFQDLFEKGLDEIWFKRVKHNIKLQTVMNQDSVGYVTENMINSLYDYGKVILLNDRIILGDTIQKEELLAQFKPYFSWDNCFRSYLRTP